MDPHARMRVKVYKLDTMNQWIDQGTGHCSCEFNSDKSEGTLVVHSEDEEDKVLLSSRIRVGDELYQRQQETLIVWSEADGVDLALSFQEAEGCGEIWDNIIEFQSHYSGDLFSDRSDTNGATSVDFALPDPDISNLAEIDEMIKETQSGMIDRGKLISFILTDNYIDKLLPVLDTCEDLESYSDLHILHSIMLGIIMLCDVAIIQYILKDEIIIGCLGMLEYDPEFDNQKGEYRDFITKRSKFKQIVPINDPEVEQKIHQTYRLRFLKDTVLSGIMDETLITALNSIIFFHNVDIVNYIHQDREFLKSLFGILGSDSETLERKRDVILFVQQFCSIAKTTQVHTRAGLYRTLSQNGLFNVFEIALLDTEPKIKMAGTEIFLSAMEHDPNLARSYIVRQAEEKATPQLMDIVLDRFLSEEDMGLKMQFSEIIRILLDTNTNQNDNGMQVAMDTIPNLDPDADKFLELFYTPYVAKFVSPLMELTEGKLSTCIANDEFFHRHLVKQNVIQQIVELLLSTNNRNNLLNSACIEFFDFIRSENIKTLITHIVPLYGEKLKNIEYVNTFKALIRRYEQFQDNSAVGSEAAEAALSESSSVRRGGPDQKAWSSLTVDDDEEAYFNNSDDEDEVPDEGKQEDDPPTSDLRRRVKEDSDEDAELEEHGGFAGQSMEKDLEPIILASQTSPPPPPSLLRRKLVDYGEDEDDDEGDEAFFRHTTRTGGAGPSSLPPPEKKIKLDQDEDDSDQDHTMEDSTDSSEKTSGVATAAASSTLSPTTASTEGASPPIKFKLNTIRNGRSPSPLPLSNSKSRSASPVPAPLLSVSSSTLSPTSPLPPIAMRTGIAFVKASSVEGESESSGGASKSGTSENGGEIMSEAAIHLRSDLARDFKRADDDEEDIQNSSGTTHGVESAEEGTKPAVAATEVPKPDNDNHGSVDERSPDSNTTINEIANLAE
ncbi:Platinum sensitivity protein [Mortierella polycephala]|uniref:Platinum sensitivity protein n=1 Tax=Mortierella polycephala TaxID=41804 RepID=A0A9P6QG32_9FUNG|nr:Platinum sensitivity protein [Mortierella polycephala]